MTGCTRTETDAPIERAIISTKGSAERAMTVATQRLAQIIDPVIGLYLFITLLVRVLLTVC